MVLLLISTCVSKKRYSNHTRSIIAFLLIHSYSSLLFTTANNNLVSSYIPTEVRNFKYLERLHLFGNTIGGGVPDLSQLSNLKSLGLMNLDLRGTIPSSLGEMTALTTLALGQTKIFSTIPDSIAKLTNLRILGLDGLGLTGKIDPVLKLNKLEALYMEDNHLSGEIYNSDWQSMKELDISNNMIDGRLPDNLFHNTNLHVIDLHRNLIFGDFPQKLVNNDGIEYIALQGNTISGALSDRIGYLINLKHLDVSGNKMSGTIPDTIQLLTNLVSLSTSGNSFDRQPLDNFFTPLINLQDISMKGNSFTGTLPDFFSLMTNLRMLDLDGNELRGTIPTWYGTMINLAILQLNRNELTGTIPSELSRLSRLKVLLLDGNNLTGETKEICNSGGPQLDHFTSDCYPSMKSEAGPEVKCRCCTLCCNDENPDCNNKDWSSSYDPKAQYGYIRPAYEFSLDQAPEGWQKKVLEEAQGATSDTVMSLSANNQYSF
jgi:Leucine-rich repeat (LRR) protein